MTNKQYNVARIDDMGVELIEVHPYVDKRTAREIRVRMKRTFPMYNYVVVNMNSYQGLDEDGYAFY